MSLGPNHGVVAVVLARHGWEKNDADGDRLRSYEKKRSHVSLMCSVRQ